MHVNEYLDAPAKSAVRSLTHNCLDRNAPMPSGPPQSVTEMLLATKDKANILARRARNIFQGLSPTPETEGEKQPSPTGMRAYIADINNDLDVAAKALMEIATYLGVDF